VLPGWLRVVDEPVSVRVSCFAPGFMSLFSRARVAEQQAELSAFGSILWTEDHGDQMHSTFCTQSTHGGT
jgi:hypothetical protein